MSAASGSSTYTVRVTPDKGGTRLDRWLADSLPHLSRTRVKALIEAGRVHLASEQGGNGTVVTDPAGKVRPGQCWRIEVPPAEAASPAPQAMSLNVVFEDRHLLVIDKPAGLVVHPAPGNRDRTLVNALLAHCGDDLSGVGGVARPGIVHRLDKDTSGLMVVAKTDAAHRGLATQLAARLVERAYRAVVWGLPNPRQGEVAGNIGRNPANRKKMAVVRTGGKPALTRYVVLRRVGTLASLIECRLATGRTHQIRVHMASLGHPVIGDPLYTGRVPRRIDSRARALAEAAVTRLNRQALHACLIGFRHPTSGEVLRFVSYFPRDINKLLLQLEDI